jgi:hypothetical protein
MLWHGAKEDEVPYRIMDLLREPISPRCRQRRPSKTTTGEESDEEGLSPTPPRARPLFHAHDAASLLPFPADHRSHVKRWRDFNYPVLRVALKDFLDQPVSEHLALTRESWSDGVARTAQDLEAGATMDWGSLMTLGAQLNLALACAVRQLEEDDYDRLDPALYLNAGWRESMPAQEPEGGSRAYSLEFDWALHVTDHGHEEELPVVVGDNMTAEEFPLGLLGRFDREGRLEERVETALRQIGTVCWCKGTPYAFVLTPEGAALLLFGLIHQQQQHGQKRQPDNEATEANPPPPPALDVRYTVVPWEETGSNTDERGDNNDNTPQVPLLMALWSLCMIAWCDYDRSSWYGTAARLNTWREVLEKGKKIHTHLLLPQDNRGHPPGAKIIPGAELPIERMAWKESESQQLQQQQKEEQGEGGEEGRQGVEIPTRSYMFEMWHPGDLDSPLEDGGSLPSAVGSSSVSISPAMESFRGTKGTNVERGDDKFPHKMGGGVCFQVPTAGGKMTDESRSRPDSVASDTSTTGSAKPIATVPPPRINASKAVHLPAASHHSVKEAVATATITATLNVSVSGNDSQCDSDKPPAEKQSFQTVSKRKRNASDAGMSFTEDDPSESWSKRLRPRKRKPNYRDW